MANLPSTQSALLATSIGKPLSIITSHPVPMPSPSQLLLKVSTASLNPHDQKSRDLGLFIADSLPAILTNDVVGTIVSLGSEAQASSRYKVGDRVLSHAGIDGKSLQNGLQQYAIADADFSMRIPENVSDDDAVTLPTNVIASLVALFDDSGFGLPAPWRPEAKNFDYASQTILIVGGGSNCGRFGVQLAKLVGFGRIVVVGGDDQELKGYGASHVLDRHGSYDDVLNRIRDIVGDDLLYSYDAVSPPSEQKLAIAALSTKRRGTMVRLRTSLGGDTDISPYNKDFERKWILGSSQVHASLCKEFWERAAGWMQTGVIKASPYQSIKVQNWEQLESEVNRVLDAYRDGKRVTKTNFQLP